MSQSGQLGQCDVSLTPFPPFDFDQGIDEAGDMEECLTIVQAFSPRILHWAHKVPPQSRSDTEDTVKNNQLLKR